MRELERLGQQVNDELGGPSPDWLRRQRRDLSVALRVRPSKGGVTSWALASALLAVLVAAVWLLVPVRRLAPSGQAEQGLSALAESRSVPLADGSSLRLAAHTQARLRAGEGATRCQVDVGTVHFDVTPQHGREFSVRAGAFEVTVVGTRFSVSRDSAGVVEVAVTHGIVRVKVPNRSTPTELRAGDILRGDHGEVSIRHEAPDGVATGNAADGSAVAPEPSRAAPDAEPQVVEPSKGSSEPRAAWLRLYREHDYGAALAAAREVGVDGLLENLAVQPLSELGEVARLGGDADLALRAFQALERRFPASPQAHNALFLSGRILASRGQMGVARAQFEAYLARNGRGIHSVEALGRLVEIYATSHDSRAKATAGTYLERAPHGPYRRLCLSVLAAP